MFTPYLSDLQYISNKENRVLLLRRLHTVQAFYSCTSRPDVSQCLLVQHQRITWHWNKPGKSLTQVACESMLRSVVRSCIQPCLGNWVEIVRAVVYCARAAHYYTATGTIELRHHLYSVANYSLVYPYCIVKAFSMLNSAILSRCRRWCYDVQKTLKHSLRCYSNQ